MQTLELTKLVLPKEDKKECDKILKEYKKAYKYLSKLSIYLDAESIKIGRYLAKEYKNKINWDYIFTDELEEASSNLSDVALVLGKLNTSFIERIEKYFIKKYNLKNIQGYEDYMMPEGYRFMTHYCILVQNIISQVGDFTKKKKKTKKKKTKK